MHKFMLRAVVAVLLVGGVRAQGGQERGGYNGAGLDAEQAVFIFGQAGLPTKMTLDWPAVKAAGGDWNFTKRPTWQDGTTWQIVRDWSLDEAVRSLALSAADARVAPALRRQAAGLLADAQTPAAADAAAALLSSDNVNVASYAGMSLAKLAADGLVTDAQLRTWPRRDGLLIGTPDLLLQGDSKVAAGSLLAVGRGCGATSVSTLLTDTEATDAPQAVAAGLAQIAYRGAAGDVAWLEAVEADLGRNTDLLDLSAAARVARAGILARQGDGAGADRLLAAMASPEELSRSVAMASLIDADPALGAISASTLSEPTQTLKGAAERYLSARVAAEPPETTWFKAMWTLSCRLAGPAMPLLDPTAKCERRPASATDCRSFAEALEKALGDGPPSRAVWAKATRNGKPAGYLATVKRLKPQYCATEPTGPLTFHVLIVRLNTDDRAPADTRGECIDASRLGTEGVASVDLLLYTWQRRGFVWKLVDAGQPTHCPCDAVAVARRLAPRIGSLLMEKT